MCEAFSVHPVVFIFETFQLKFYPVHLYRIFKLSSLTSNVENVGLCNLSITFKSVRLACFSLT